MKKKIKNINVKINERVLKEANFIIERKSTVRNVASSFGIGKSTVHKDVTERLEKLNYMKYTLVNDILQANKDERAIRGGIATKQKYLQLKNNK